MPLLGSWDAYVSTSASTVFSKAGTVMTHPEGSPLLRSAVSWIVKGVAYAHLSQKQLQALTDTDYVVIKPPPSKADPFCVGVG